MQQATHIYRNGTILTMDSRCSIVSCLAVSGETILAVGSEAEVAPFQGPETRIVDLGGRFMMPGFYDCHSHFMRAGMYNKYYLDVNSHPIGDVRTHGDIRRKVREALSGMPAGEWLLCAGYDDTAVAEERHFTLAELTRWPRITRCSCATSPGIWPCATARRLRQPGSRMKP